MKLSSPTCEPPSLTGTDERKEKSSLCMFSSLLSVKGLLNGLMSPEKNCHGENFVWKNLIQKVRFAGHTEGIPHVSKFQFSESFGN